MQFKQNFTPYQYLPLYAKISIERLDSDSDLRTGEMLNSLLDAYAKTYGEECDTHSRESAHYICSRRFLGSFPQEQEQSPTSDDEAFDLLKKEIQFTNNGKLLRANVPQALRPAMNSLLAKGVLLRATFLHHWDAISLKDHHA